MSPSSRGRGLKSRGTKPLAEGLLSPSSRGRGLKYGVYNDICMHAYVALFTRAWIEISLFENKASWNNVALFTRAWIEIQRHGII